MACEHCGKTGYENAECVTGPCMQSMQFKHLKRELIASKVTQMSLIGVGRDRPVSWGNYCWVHAGRVLNMWAENIEAANKQFGLGGKVSALVASGFVFIDDDRIPPEWYCSKLCFTGSGLPVKEVVAEWFAYKGDPNNEMEQFTDPKEYYAKRGQEWDERGFIRTGQEVRKRLEAQGYGPFA